MALLSMIGQLLVSHFSEDQLDRYEYYRRCGYSRSAMKKVIQGVSGASNVPPNVIIAVCGAAKVYTSELIEQALDVQEQLQQTGPLHPDHIREADRRMNEKKARSKYGNQI